jgi:hypothetical protein
MRKSMNSIGRVIGGLLACVLLLACTGCAGNQTAIIEESTVSPSPAEEAAYILIWRGAEETVHNAAAAFAAKLNGELGLQLTVKETDNPARALAEETAKFAFARGDGDSTWSKYLPVLSTPFLYGSYDHFTMSLNSETVLEAMGEELRPRGIEPLEAYYIGSEYLLSTLDLDDYSSFRGPASYENADPKLEEEEAYTIVLRQEDTRRRFVYEQAGSRVEQETSAAQRLRKLISWEAETCEFAYDEDILSADEWEEELMVVRSWQNSEAMWLLADSAYLEGMTARDRAILEEIEASLYTHIDRVYLAREEALLAELAERQVRQSTDFTRTRRYLSTFTADLVQDLEPLEKHILDYIGEIDPD